MTGLPPTQTPARQVSGLVYSLSARPPQAVAAGMNPLSVQLPVPLQVSWLTHAVPASPQEVPAGSSLARQVPLPLQVSGLVHSVSAGLPQAVPAGLKPLSVQLPVPLQVSWLTHAVPASPQEVPAGSSLARQVPLPLQVSGLVHSVSAGLPQAVPAGLNPLSVQLPVPLQVSWWRHALRASPQDVPASSALRSQVPLT